MKRWGDCIHLLIDYAEKFLDLKLICTMNAHEPLLKWRGMRLKLKSKVQIFLQVLKKKKKIKTNLYKEKAQAA